MKTNKIIKIIAVVLIFQSSGIVAAGKGKNTNTAFDPRASLQAALSGIDETLLIEAIKQGSIDYVVKALTTTARPTQKHVDLAESLGHKDIAFFLKGAIAVDEGVRSRQFDTASAGAGNAQLPYPAEAQHMGLAAAIANFPREIIESFLRQGVRATPEHIRLAEQKGRKDVVDLLEKNLAKHAPAQPKKASSESVGASSAMPEPVKEKEKKDKLFYEGLTSFIVEEAGSHHLDDAINRNDVNAVTVLMAGGAQPTQAQINKAKKKKQADIIALLTGKAKTKITYSITWNGKAVGTFDKDKKVTQTDWDRQVKKSMREQIEREFPSEFADVVAHGAVDQAKFLLNNIAPFLRNVPITLDTFIQQAQSKGHSEMVEMLKESDQQLKTKRAEDTERERQQAEAEKREAQEKERIKQAAALEALRLKQDKEEKGKAKFQADQQRHKNKEAARIRKAEQAKQESDRHRTEAERKKQQAEEDRKRSISRREQQKAQEEAAARLKTSEKETAETNRQENELIEQTKKLAMQAQEIAQAVACLKTKKQETALACALDIAELEKQKKALDVLVSIGQDHKKKIKTAAKLKKCTTAFGQLTAMQSEAEGTLTVIRNEHTRLKEAEQLRELQVAEASGKPLKDDEADVVAPFAFEPDEIAALTTIHKDYQAAMEALKPQKIITAPQVATQVPQTHSPISEEVVEETTDQAQPMPVPTYPQQMMPTHAPYRYPDYSYGYPQQGGMPPFAMTQMQRPAPMMQSSLYPSQPYPYQYMQQSSMGAGYGAGYPMSSIPSAKPVNLLTRGVMDEAEMLRRMQKVAEPSFLDSVRDQVSQAIRIKAVRQSLTKSDKEDIEKSVYESVLMKAVGDNNREKVQLCLQHFKADIDINSVGDSGRSALQIAQAGGEPYKEIQQLLIKHGAKE